MSSARGILPLDKKYEIDRTSGCWIWTGKPTVDGYGQVCYNKKYYRAHRLFYELNKGAIPDCMVVCHKCDNRMCVNPEHLFVGSVSDNVNDKIKKNRHSHGDSHYKSKIKDVDVPIIIEMWEMGYTMDAIGFVFGVSRSAIKTTIDNKARPHLQKYELEFKYPNPPDETKRLFWKRSKNGWVQFTRRSNNMHRGKTIRIKKTCPICLDIFEAKGSIAKYCSGKCSGIAFRENNKDSFQMRASRQNQRARRIGVIGTVKPKDLMDIYNKQGGKCSLCSCNLSVTGFHVDHVISMSSGGNNLPDNIQMLCPKDNLTKNK